MGRFMEYGGSGLYWRVVGSNLWNVPTIFAATKVCDFQPFAKFAYIVNAAQTLMNVE